MAALGAVGAPALAACGGGDSSTPGAAATTTGPADTATTAETSATTGAAATTSATTADGSTGPATSASRSAAQSAGTTPSSKPSSKPTTKPSTKPADDPAKGALVALSKVPVGGSLVVSGVVVTRTGANSAVGHSVSCTHRGCAVVPAGSRLTCPCHDSAFDARSGSVLQGPATKPLPAVRLVVRGGYVHRA